MLPPMPTPPNTCRAPVAVDVALTTVGIVIVPAVSIVNLRVVPCTNCKLPLALVTRSLGDS